MKRVASLYLPHWSIDRIAQRERRHAPPPEQRAAAADLAPLADTAAAERAMECDAPKNTGWRPGARWAKVDRDVAARADTDRRIAALPAHQRPPMRELGRRSEAAEMPFKRLPGDDGGKATGWSERPAVQRRDPAVALSAWNAVPAVRYPGEGPRPDKHGRRGSNDPHAPPPGVATFFDTGRSTAATVARVCPEASRPRPAVSPAPQASVLVTVHKAGSRVEIAAASPAAAALGVVPGMALTQARASLPTLEVRDADPAGDRGALERLALALARRWCPIVAVSDADGLFLDLTGVAHLHGSEARFARRLVRLLARFGIAARVAVADTTGAAWALARHARDAITVAADHHAALAPLPVAALRLDEAARELLARLGIETVGELMAMPRGPLVRRFGGAITRRLDQATGAAAEPLDPVIPVEAIVVERRFAEPIATAEAIGHWLDGLVGELSDALARAGVGARALLFVADRVDHVAQVLRIGLARATRDPQHIRRLIARRIEEIDPGFGIESLALHVVRADPLGPEALGAALAEQQAPDLAPLVDALANRIGQHRLWRSTPVESDVPERAVARHPPLDPLEKATPALRRDDVRRLDTRAAPDPWHPRWPRPVRLLYRPERLDNVLAELPDRPPVRFTWRGVGHRVVRADGPERIAGEWWRHRSERDAIRDYFQVEDESGQRFWLFRRGDGLRPVTGDLSWYLHGTFG